MHLKTTSVIIFIQRKKQQQQPLMLPLCQRCTWAMLLFLIKCISAVLQSHQTSTYPLHWSGSQHNASVVLFTDPVHPLCLHTAITTPTTFTYSDIWANQHDRHNLTDHLINRIKGLLLYAFAMIACYQQGFYVYIICMMCMIIMVLHVNLFMSWLALYLDPRTRFEGLICGGWMWLE